IDSLGLALRAPSESWVGASLLCAGAALTAPDTATLDATAFPETLLLSVWLFSVLCSLFSVASDTCSLIPDTCFMGPPPRLARTTSSAAAPADAIKTTAKNATIRFNLHWKLYHKTRGLYNRKCGRGAPDQIPAPTNASLCSEYPFVAVMAKLPK
ncbi:MAG: hypothetical protein LBL46_03525, partial [Rickettsiales bacterium]|nr:hypothetical protein [Rickettsiales bacterium]